VSSAGVARVLDTQGLQRKAADSPHSASMTTVAHGVLQTNKKTLAEKPLRNCEDPVRTVDARPQESRRFSGHHERAGWS
jgi:hypothetical protein